MSNVAAMYAATQFIETHLRDPIGVADVATAVSYSPYHFSRIFNKAVHHPPYDYLMRRRVTDSAQELLQTETSITDIAFLYQFNNLETFSRAFRRIFGVQPRRWRQQGVRNRRQGLLPLTRAHLKYRAGLLPLTLLAQPALSLVGLMSQVSADATSVKTLWQLLDETANLPDATRYGVLTATDMGGAFFYLAGAAAETAVFTHPLLVTKTIPAGQYACFRHHGAPDALPLLQDYIYQTWLPQSGHSLASPLELHRYKPCFLEANEIEVLLPLAES